MITVKIENSFYSKFIRYGILIPVANLTKYFNFSTSSILKFPDNQSSAFSKSSLFEFYSPGDSKIPGFVKEFLSTLVSLQVCFISFWRLKNLYKFILWPIGNLDVIDIVLCIYNEFYIF